MTAFSFIHAADLHLGSPLSSLATRDADLARRLASAGRQAFEDLVSQAIERAVAFVVVAGDVYDGDWADTTIGLFFARQVARLDRAGIPTVLVRGNHDAESVITRSITLPAWVHVFPSARASTLRLDALRVAIHGRSFQGRAVEENLSLTYPAAVAGWFNLGVLHTSCTGHAAHETYAPCSVADLAARGYESWALGHIHEYAELSRDPWIVFPGNLQGRSVRECGEKGAVVVDVADGRVHRPQPPPPRPGSVRAGSRSISPRWPIRAAPSRPSRPPWGRSPPSRRAGSCWSGSTSWAARRPTTPSRPTGIR